MDLEDLSRLSAYQLIDKLNELVPARCILPNESEAHAHRYAGSRELVDQLLEIKAEQESATETA